MSQEIGQCDDIAIIGAGIAGTYAAWRLRQQNKRISIYEYSNRVGGRMYTVQFPAIPDINVELGGMRYLRRSHALLHETIQQLGLPIKRFDLGSGPSPDTIVNVRGVHLRYDELGGNKTPYRLRPNERKPIDQLTWEVFRNYTDVLTTNVPETDKKFYVRDRSGVVMYKRSVQSLYHKYLSAEAQNYIRETNGFSTLSTEDSASLAVQTSSPPTESEDVLTVVTGFSSIPNELLRRFLRDGQRHSIKHNHDLKAIKKRRDGYYNLIFEPTISNSRTSQSKSTIKKCAKKVILAVNRLSLEKLDWQGLYQPRIREYITKAVKDIPAAKLYFSYDSPWWRRSPVYSDYLISDTPLRQTYDFGTSILNPSKSVLQAMYTDTDVSYWEELFNRAYGNETSGDFVNGKELDEVTKRYLSDIYKIPIRTIPRPTNAAVIVWKNYPYGGAWQTWMPGYIWPTVERQMTKPSLSDDVFVVSNAFNSRSFSDWGNGALQAVELAMPYFGLRRIE
ncbi:aplysianin-A-like [Mytilus californianus]|uniref:aplysianin-A-like n=1 Tax=Mytilus californianus TaxID=6549 RepID=UPI0022472FB4|nr:aplysianin-A-like [Mytilus californianus]